MQQQETVEGELVDDDEERSTDLALLDYASAMQMMQQAGHIVPTATPRQLRQAAALQQRIYTAILDERDYMYVVSYESTDGGRKSARQSMTMVRAEADALAVKFSGTVSAKPKKSGITKLARALGIVCKTLVREEKTVRGVVGFYVAYQARHDGTGLVEEGIGWCDPSERRGNMSIHDMISTADTRAYNRAVLRLAGFGDVSADEILANASSDDNMPDYLPAKSMPNPLAALPSPKDDRVLTASRAWAEAITKRNGSRFAAEAQQNTMDARGLRALARRGDETAANKLGALGIRWAGVAQDGVGQPVFDVEESFVSPEDVRIVAAADEVLSTPRTETGKGDGWDLSGAGKDDVAAAESAAEPQSTSAIPQPNPTAETITTGQAKKVSELLLAVFDNDKDKARQWVAAEAHVSGSIHIRSNQYGAILSALQAMTKKES